MVSFVMVLALALTTLYMGVYVAEWMQRVEMRRCLESSRSVQEAREE